MVVGCARIEKMIVLRRVISWGLLPWLGLTAAHAQSTLGEVLDKGGTRIDASHWRAMLPHQNFGFGQKSLNRTQVIFSEDGKLSGSESPRDLFSTQANASQRSRSIKGSWQMEADGKMCIDQVFGRYESVYSGCFYMFRLDDTIFHVDAGSETDRSAAVTRRSVEP